MASAPPIARSSMGWWGASQRPYQKVKHPVHAAAVRRAEGELVQITLHLLAADLDVG